MSDFQINPPDIDRQYLECLNTTFGNWGTAEQFDWYFRRKTIFPAADLLIFRENGKLAAGSGITYRFVQLPDQEKIIAGIMTGSWTLPQYRRKGFFSGIIEESQQQAAKKNAKLLLAFVTKDNSSFRQLQKSGAILFPSFYLFSTQSTPLPSSDEAFEPIEPNEKILTEIFERFVESGNGQVRLAYPSPTDFRSQFLERIGLTEILLNRHDRSVAILEKKNATDSVQFFWPAELKSFAALLTRTLKEGRKFFTFTMQPEIAELGENLGLGIKEGFLTALPTTLSFLLTDQLKWSIQNGDRA